MSTEMIGLLISSFWETLEMVIASTAIAFLLGLPLGIILFLAKKNKLWNKPIFYRVLSGFVNAMRSIPFIILMVAIIPLTRVLVGTSIGTFAAIVPLSLCAIPFFARLTETALEEISGSLIEASQAMGASLWQIIYYVLIPESLPSLIRAITLTAITLVGYSAMAGAIGGGGLGDLAIRYGYERFEVGVMVLTVLVLIALVQLIQFLGDLFASKLSHEK